jgi:hypothetical protein
MLVGILFWKKFSFRGEIHIYRIMTKMHLLLRALDETF